MSNAMYRKTDTPLQIVEEPNMRVRHLFDLGSSVDVDFNIPPRRYFRSGFEMIRMATVYMDEENLENAYILFSKFITLFVEKLPQHPDYKNSPVADKVKIKKKLKDAFPVAEIIKCKLHENYKKEFETYLEKKAHLDKLESERIKLEEAERKKQELRKLEEEKQKFNIETALESLKLSDTTHTVAEIPPLEKISYDWPNPELTPKSSDLPSIPNIPSRTLKPVSDYPALPAETCSSNSKLIPSFDRTAKPSLLSPGFEKSFDFKLRTVVVPVSIVTEFLSLAKTNTNRNIETCGILTGKLAQNKFTITHLLVPKQKGTSDSCTTENEEELFEIQDQHELVTLGWIHTHPSQTSFMSSVDLHTHCAYQLMLPEAIAIVCSPKFDETGIFSLTNEYGLSYIANCHQAGFHPHPKEPPLYSESQHYVMDTSTPISVIDLR